jgi:hypothetical protein
VVRLPRWFVVLVSLLLVANPFLTGVLSIYRYKDPEFAVIALVLYLLAGFASVLYAPGIKIPLVFALSNLSLAIAVPLLVNASLDLELRGSQATWYVTAIATLMGITALRQHAIIAWIGSAILFSQVVGWGGLEFLFNSGLAGGLGLVIAGHAISIGLQRSAKEVASYLELAKETEASSAIESAIRQERSRLLKDTLRTARPILETISTGKFEEQDKKEAMLTEAELRDKIRGRLLINEKLRISIRSARSRGVEVVVLDEGGLSETHEAERETLRLKVAEELDRVSEGRVTIRAPHQGDAKVTFVASRSGVAKPDVFLKL